MTVDLNRFRMQKAIEACDAEFSACLRMRYCDDVRMTKALSDYKKALRDYARADGRTAC